MPRFDLSTVHLQSRDGSLTKGGLIKNGFVEKDVDGVWSWQRPALSSLAAGLGTGQGLITLNGTMYSIQGGTLYYYQTGISTSSISLQTNTATYGLQARLGTAIYRINFNDGLVYSSPVQSTLAFSSVGTSTMIAANPALSQVTEFNSQVAAYIDNGAGSSKIVSSPDGITWSNVDTGLTGSVGLVGFASRLFRFQNLATGQDYTSYPVSPFTPSAGGTQTSAFGSFSIISPIVGSAGGNIWAIGTAIWTGGTQILALRGSNAGTGDFTWNLVSTGSGPLVAAGAQQRIGWDGSRALLVLGTGGVGWRPTAVPQNGSAWTALMTATGSSIAYNMLSTGTNHYLFGVLNQGRLGVAQGTGNIVAAAVTSVVSGQRGMVASNSKTYLAMQGVGGASVYNLVNGTSGPITGINFPAIMVPGMQYLDGTFYVMDPSGTIWNSTPAADDPTTWPTDGFVSAQFEPDSGVCLSKCLNYIVALGQWTVELFWDGNTGLGATGSPLFPVNNGVLLIGCATADSVAQTESTIVWMAQRKADGSTSHKGRFIAMLVGTSYEELSNPDVSRVLEADDLAQVRASIWEIDGHTWYLLNLGTTNITLVFDLKYKQWYVWTRLSNGTPKTISAIGQTNGVATGTSAAHGISDGDAAVIAGVNPAGYNGTFNVSVNTSANTFQYPVSSALTGTGTGASMTITPYAENAMGIVASMGFNNNQVAMDLSGNIYNLSIGIALEDGSIPINWRIRTQNTDEGTNNNKFYQSVAVIGDVAGTATGLIRAIDNDYRVYGYFKRFDLSQVKCDEHRWGAARKRAWEWVYTDRERFRIKELEVDLLKGVT